MPVQNFRRRILREWPAIAPLIKASYQASMPFPGPQRPFRAWLGLFGIPPPYRSLETAPRAANWPLA